MNTPKPCPRCGLTVPASASGSSHVCRPAEGIAVSRRGGEIFISLASREPATVIQTRMTGKDAHSFARDVFEMANKADAGGGSMRRAIADVQGGAELSPEDEAASEKDAEAAEELGQAVRAFLSDWLDRHPENVDAICPVLQRIVGVVMLTAGGSPDDVGAFAREVAHVFEDEAVALRQRSAPNTPRRGHSRDCELVRAFGSYRIKNAKCTCGYGTDRPERGRCPLCQRDVHGARLGGVWLPCRGGEHDPSCPNALAS